MSNYKIPQNVFDDFEKFKVDHQNFLNGTLDELTFKTIRVPFGVYEQRNADTYMTRIKLTGGKITPKQLLGVCELSHKYGNDFVHVTSRGGAQIHYVKIEDIIEVVGALHTLELSSRGGGGNTVRNITVDPLAGVATDEIFDVTPYAIAMTEKMLAQKDSYALPRKFKITFSGSDADRGHATISDVGFIATTHNGQKGFHLFVAGGLGAKYRKSDFLFEFIPDNEIFLYAQSIKQLFDKHGNRKNKHHARLRFLIDDLGREKFLDLLHEELNQLREKDNWQLDIPQTKESIKVSNDDAVNLIREQQIWWDRYVYAQKQEGLYGCKIPINLGELHYLDGIKLAKELEPFGEDTIRFATDQNMYIRNLHKKDLLSLQTLIEEISSGATKSSILADMVACTGAATCQLGITRPRGALEKIALILDKSGIDLDSLGGFKIHLSGCPNSCAKHQIADLGFYGKIARKDGHPYPAYNVLAGGVVTKNKTVFGHKSGDVSAFYVAEFVQELLTLWIDERENYNSFNEWVEDGNIQTINEIAKKYKDVPLFNEDKNPYFDYDSDEIFSTKGRGTGECSAGMYDLIEADKKALKEQLSLETKDLKQIRLLSARMLLVTRGEDQRDEKGVLLAFKTHFIDTDLIDKRFTNLIEGEALNEKDVVALGNEVLALYETMDNTLKFEKEKNNTQAKEGSATNETAQGVTKFKDYFGVACPMNFVKTKMDLATMKSGEVLEILLDDGSPIDSVPKSVANEGHTIVSQTKEGAGWRVRIIKK